MTDKQLVEAVEKHRVELQKKNGKGHNTDKERMVLQRRIILQRRELRRLNRRMLVLKLRLDNAALEKRIAVSDALRNAAELAETYTVKGSHKIADAIRKWI